MAVYSSFSSEQLVELGRSIGGRVSNLSAIESGISNSIYKADLVNDVGVDEVIIIIHETPDRVANGVPSSQSLNIPNLMCYAADNIGFGEVCDVRGRPVDTIIPKPYKWHSKQNFGVMKFPHAIKKDLMVDKTVSVIPFIEGRVLDWSSDTCHSIDIIEQAGQSLAAFHKSVEGFPDANEMPNTYGVDRGLASIDNLLSDPSARLELQNFLNIKKSVYSSEDILCILADEADYIEQNWGNYTNGLSRNIIHGDYFPDNTIITNSGAMAIIDFGNCALEVEMYDVVLSVNAWVSQNGAFDPERVSAFLNGYSSVKPLCGNEMQMLPFLGRVASFSRALLRIDIALSVADPYHANSPEDCVSQLKYWRNMDKINLDEPEISL